MRFTSCSSWFNWFSRFEQVAMSAPGSALGPSADLGYSPRCTFPSGFQSPCSARTKSAAASRCRPHSGRVCSPEPAVSPVNFGVRVKWALAAQRPSNNKSPTSSWRDGHRAVPFSIFLNFFDKRFIAVSIRDSSISPRLISECNEAPKAEIQRRDFKV